MIIIKWEILKGSEWAIAGETIAEPNTWPVTKSCSFFTSSVYNLVTMKEFSHNVLITKAKGRVRLIWMNGLTEQQ